MQPATVGKSVVVDHDTQTPTHAEYGFWIACASRGACAPHFVRQPLPWFRDSAQAHSPLNLRRGAAEPARATRSAP
ncbi:MAG: hypothetical protein FWG15_03120, partial [Propionibacteriaceae bacterium]|nr:hypothetical protein [Propionibacteriaceae bacterium]